MDPTKTCSRCSHPAHVGVCTAGPCLCTWSRPSYWAMWFDDDSLAVDHSLDAPIPFRLTARAR